MAATGSKLGWILYGMKQKLIADGVYTAQSCRIAMRMNVPQHTKGRDYAVILPLMHTFNANNFIGQGRYSSIVSGRINVYVRHQDAKDQAYYDDIWLVGQDGNGGALGELDRVMDSLDGWNPTLAQVGFGTSSVALLADELRWVFTNEPRKDYASPDWGEVMAECEVKYRAWRNN